MNTATELAEFNAIESRLSQIKEEGNFVPDMTTKEGYEASKRYVLDVTAIAKKDLEEARKKAKSYWIDGGKSLDKSAQQLLDSILQCEVHHKEAYREHDKKKKVQKERLAQEIQIKIDFFHDFKIDLSESSQESIEDLINSCGEVDTTEGFYYRALDAEKARSESLDYLNSALVKSVNRDIEIARIKRIEEENKEKEDELNLIKKKMEEQQKELDHAVALNDNKDFDEKKEAKIKELEEKARLKAEEESRHQLEIAENFAAKLKQDAIDRENQAKKDAINAEWLAVENEAYNDDYAFDAERKSAIDAKQAEQRRINDVETARLEEVHRQKDAKAKIDAETARREADTKYKTKVHQGIITAFVGVGISKEDSIKAMKLLVSKKVPQASVNY